MRRAFPWFFFASLTFSRAALETPAFSDWVIAYITVNDFTVIANAGFAQRRAYPAADFACQRQQEIHHKGNSAVGLANQIRLFNVAR